MSKATWDTKKAKGMWQAGFSDTDIAKEVGTTAASVSYYRRKYWVDNPPREGVLPDGAEERDTNESAELDPETERAGSDGLVCDEGAEKRDDRPLPEHRTGARGREMNRSKRKNRKG